jgi:competence protein ComEC
MAPYGVLANLLAMPVVSAWVMPMGLLGLIAIPFGFDAECWRQMGYGIEWMDKVALWVANLPGAVGHVTAFGTGPLLLETIALLLIGLLRTPLRWSGIGFAIVGVVWALSVPRPDVLVAADGRSVAVRGADGHFAFHHTGGDAFAIREWLAADADARDYHDRGLGAGIACDPFGCIGKLGDGSLVAYDTAPDALEEDCRRALLVVTLYDPPPGCAAQVIDRPLWRERGALALRRTASGFAIESARAPNFDRPWSPQWPSKKTTVDVRAGAPATPQVTPPDATPKDEDIEADQ